MWILYQDNRLIKNSLDALRRFSGNSKGVASIEFAMILPIMVVIFIGTIEFSQAITVNRRVNHVTSHTADLITQAQSLTTAELDNIIGIVKQFIVPYDATPLKLTATNVVASINNPNYVEVCWSYNDANGGVTNYAAGSSFNLPASGLIGAGESVVVVEVEYLYTPTIFSLFIEQPITFSETFYAKPRMSSWIKYNGDDCTPPVN